MRSGKNDLKVLGWKNEVPVTEDHGGTSVYMCMSVSVCVGR